MKQMEMEVGQAEAETFFASWEAQGAKILRLYVGKSGKAGEEIAGGSAVSPMLPLGDEPAGIEGGSCGLDDAAADRVYERPEDRCGCCGRSIIDPSFREEDREFLESVSGLIRSDQFTSAIPSSLVVSRGNGHHVHVRHSFTDPLFGRLWAARAGWWEGDVDFDPLTTETRFLIKADAEGPTEIQRKWFMSIEERYVSLEPRILLFVMGELNRRGHNLSKGAVERTLRLEVLTIATCDDGGKRWEIVFSVRGVKEWLVVQFLNWDLIEAPIA